MSQSLRHYSSTIPIMAERQPTPSDSAPALGVAGFLRTFFRLMDENEVCYCILHSWGSLSASLMGDVDIAVYPRDRGKLSNVLQGLFEEGYCAIQHRWRGGRGRRYDFAWSGSEGMEFASIDSIDDYVENGLVLISNKNLLKDRRKVDEVWIASPVVEFTYLLAKKTVKGNVPRHQVERFKTLVLEIGTRETQRIAASLFGDARKEAVADACATGTIGALVGELRRPMFLTRIRKAPLGTLRFMVSEVPRVISRIVRPIGVFLVILGPDGAGKSTLVGRIAELLEQAAFNRFRLFHWRPNVVFSKPDTGVPSSDPHDEPPRGSLGSTAALLAILLDYILGYIFILRPFLARAGLVIFDRYYDDLLVDPLRYRYGGPMWLARLLRHFIPPPDLLFLVLDADEKVILARKQEVPPEELSRQRESYRLFTQESQHATLIRTDVGIEQTANEACRFIVDYLVQRFQRRYGPRIQGGNRKPHVEKADDLESTAVSTRD